MLLKAIKFKLIKTTDQEYPQELMLRWEVLRKPLGMPPGSEVFSNETESLHLVALDKKKVVGCVLFHPETTESGSLDQLAVSEEYRGRGFGRKLLAFLEQELQKRGFKKIRLLSGEESIGFYLERGYQPIGTVIEKIGVPHQPMEKSLH